MFSDGQYHNCGPYLDLEKKFFGENAAIVREVFFDTNNLLGVDSEEDLDVEDALHLGLGVGLSCSWLSPIRLVVR
ncbi:MAG: hypothetical protein ACK56I_35530, partial [bacterium]